ncbi:hypothetical protein AAVH_11931 [Aphelenchoides avenae]|nr:hypothetical protein AAVH_11931 [Aphelenchus avenae]
MSSTLPVLPRVNDKWRAIYKLYREPAPLIGYLDSLELALVLKGAVDDADVQAMFAHRKPLEFWGCPRLLVPKIIEAFRALQKEPTYLNVTITALSFLGVTRPSEAWPRVYRTHLPCYACTTVQTVDEGSNLNQKYEEFENPFDTVDFVVEKFHVSAKNFRKRLTLELHYQLEQRMSQTEREKPSFIHKIIIRLTNDTCSPQAGQPAIAHRSSATLLLLPEFASEVFGFLDRAHIGSSLLASRALHDLVCRLKQRLPVHHLKCVLEKELLVRGFGCERWYTGACWMQMRHLQRELSYTDVRRFTLPSTAGAGDDCALIRHYLGNSHVADMRVREAHSAGLFPFAIKMLASLAARNVSVDRMDLRAGAKRLADYRSMDAVFGRMRMSELHLSCLERCFVELVKTTDFFLMSSVQRLRTLRLDLNDQWNNKESPRGLAKSKSPLWIPGIYLLRNCEYYQVNYRSDRHLRSIERRMVHICEEFERGKIADTVKHFQFSTVTEMSYAFNLDNLLVSGMKVEGLKHCARIRNFIWDVYRFRNANTSEYLTACVGLRETAYSIKHVLHIMKGEMYPDASFADF